MKLLTLVAELGLLPGLLAAQNTITGRVTDQNGGAPLVGARVSVLGTSLQTTTAANGQYRLTGVPLGSVAVRFVQIGYGAVTKTANVVSGGETTLDAALTVTPYQLDDFVVTATGDQQRREIGNAVSTLDVGNLVPTSSINNMSDLLVAKIPGVQVLPGTQTGAGGRIRIRGNSSLSLSNEPIIVVDGVRIQSNLGSTSISVGGSAPSRLDDINPEDIESIDVIKGPSASSLYGTDAANGVIVIKTKRGQAGAPKWSTYVEQGFIKDYNRYPSNYRAWRNGSTPTNTTQCLLFQVSAGTCVQDSVTSFNLFDDPESSPNGTGYRQKYGAQVGGGSETVRYYLSADWEKEIGQLRMPTFAEARFLDARKVSEVPEEQLRPNGLTRTNFRANLNANLGDKADIAVSTGFVSSRQRLPQTDNNTTGVLSNAFGGPGNKNNGRFGWRRFTPDEIFSETVSQTLNRFVASGTANYRPTSWLAGRATVGFDFGARVDSDLCRRGECVNIGTQKAGFKTNNRTSLANYTADANLTATRRLASTLTSKSTVGVQYIKNNFNRNGAQGSDLPPGATTTTGGAIQLSDELTAQSVTVGAFVEEALGYKDRLFLTGALRSDRNSAFGSAFKAAYYPKVALSYVLSDEPFFPKGNTLANLRLRGAYGASGRQPNGTDALRFFAPRIVTIGDADVAALSDSALGNPTLKPERSQEVELGLDASFFDSKLNLEVTYFNKKSRDALINRIIAPSAGSAISRFENIGAVQNSGWEAVINTTLANQKSFGWDFTISGSWLSNKITDLGGTAPAIGTVTSQKEGFPIDAFFQHPYTYADTNNDGIISANEITVGPDQVFVGYSIPRAEISATTGIEFFGRKLRIAGLVDFKGGHRQLNDTERIRCNVRLNCRGMVDPKAPLDEQARAIALTQHPTRTQYGFMEKADFLRFRELSATWSLPDRWARAVGASRLGLTVAGRNLGIITGYKGVDPESAYFDATATAFANDFQTAPPPSYWTFRLNVSF